MSNLLSKITLPPLSKTLPPLSKIVSSKHSSKHSSKQKTTKKGICQCLMNMDSNKIWNIYENMKFGDNMMIKIELPACKCTSQDCFDFGTRIVYQMRKTEMIEIESYFSEELNDVIDHERKPGLEFYKKQESWNETKQQWKTNIFGKSIIFRLQINEEKHTIKLSHYRNSFYGWENCDKYHQETLQEEKKLIEELISEMNKNSKI